MDGMKLKKTQQVLSLLTCALMMAAVAINMNHKIMGNDISGGRHTQVKSTQVSSVLDDGTMVINTTQLGKDITGYAGNVPLEIYVKHGHITAIKPLPNSEAPDFFQKATSLLARWVGKTPKEAANMRVDAVTGATYSSKAIIGNMRVGSIYAMKSPVKVANPPSENISAKFVIGLVVALMAAILPLFIHDKRYHLAQLALNVVVLGLWCGTFISYSLIVNFLSNGVNAWMSIIPLIMIITAFIYPLFNKKQYYCANICPFGSLQQLAGKCGGKQLKMGRRVTKTLDYFRQGLWAALMLCLWSGVLFGWMDYEPFTAFMFTSASTAVIIIAVAFLALSFFVKRPYCRFVCPTGTLLKVSETSK